MRTSLAGSQGMVPATPGGAIHAARAGPVQAPSPLQLTPSACQSSEASPAHEGRPSPGAPRPAEDVSALHGNVPATAPAAPSPAVPSASPEIAAAAAAAVASLSESGKVDEGLLAKTIAALTAKQKSQAPGHPPEASLQHAGVQPRLGPMQGVSGLGPPQVPLAPRQFQPPQAGMPPPPLRPHHAPSLITGPHVPAAPYPEGTRCFPPDSVGLAQAGVAVGDSSGNSSHSTGTANHRPPHPPVPAGLDGPCAPSSQGDYHCLHLALASTAA